MADYDLAIRGGIITTASDTFRGDIGVRAGRIVAIADRVEGAAREIDASGLRVMPGGIDSHVHLSQPAFGGPKMADDFLTGTRSAIAGGNTTVLPFALQPRGASLRASVTDYHKEADGKCFADYGFHLIITDPSASVLGQELPALVEDGYTSFKVFMTYDDLVLNDRELLEVPIMIVDVSGRQAMEQIRWAQQRGLQVYGETCPQYIALTADDLKGLNMDESGSKYVCSPPPRDRASWDAIWEGLTQGVFQTFSSDHCPFYFEGPMGKKNAKARTSFRWVPNGIPGVETRLPILWSKGVAEGRITANEFVALTSTNHAKMYGLYPDKGSIAVGFDADLVLWDDKRKETIRQELMHQGADYTPYEGLAVTGWPVMTILRGKVVAEEGRILAEPGDGVFLRRGISPYAAG